MAGAHGHHEAAAGNQAVHYHNHRLFFPKAASFDVELLAGRRSPTRGGQLYDHAFDTGVLPAVFQVGGNNGGGVFAYTGKRYIHDANIGFAG